MKASTTVIYLKCPRDVLLDMKKVSTERTIALQKVALEAWMMYLARPEIRTLIEKGFDLENEV